MVNTSQMYRFFLMRKETCWFRLSLTICWYIDYYISICWNNCDSVVLSSRFPPSRLLDFSQWSCQYSVANIVPHSTIYRHCFTSSDELWTLILSFHMKLALNCLCLYLVCLFVCFCRWLHFQCCYRRLDCCVSLIFILISVLFILFYYFFFIALISNGWDTISASLFACVFCFFVDQTIGRCCWNCCGEQNLIIHSYKCFFICWGFIFFFLNNFHVCVCCI